MTGEQLTLGEQLRDDGIARVWGGTENPWRELAMSAIALLARTGREFTSEDVRDRAGDPPKPNAMGAAFQYAARAGWIAPVGYVRACRPGMHATELRIWRGASAP